MFPGNRGANVARKRSWLTAELGVGERRAAGRRGLKLAAADRARGGRSWPDPGRPSRRRRHEVGGFGGASKTGERCRREWRFTEMPVRNAGGGKAGAKGGAGGRAKG